MNLKRALFLLVLIPMLALAFQSCNKCKETGDIDFSASAQSLSVTYVDSADSNLVNIANPSNITVLLNTEGGKGPYSPLSEDLTDGVFGPFDYTTTPKTAQLGVPYDYVYVIQLDTFAVDTFRVVFVPMVDECKEFWQGLEFYRNDSLVSSGSEIVDLTYTVN